ncbi:MAG: tRNA 2-thiouridine(34) synthase MnmA [Candidatus Doudnabacteria bacterium RIFCSPHIGHO2_01_FULL_50_11]|uniref:tRNA-specific 2-thiouridylase MnmA n=1 Tax=Candidatus Doudnabacteria bacterium RIFCSPHIGHO2_01_FULL_50_11 TaxID=1817828 RepID=A0A1F5PE89_9BACT|nr:MAG: tRNA 2-thiouridine(34) synthase MnmA [Candidatus Doudnabacteria bacterium RIFCSPHIGHO2_01_FULL_50_11]
MDRVSRSSDMKKIYVAMSGGVDSAVAALLLKRMGHELTGVYMKNWSDESFQGKLDFHCPWKEDLAMVKRVCAAIGIPWKVYNFEQEYRKSVIDYFFRLERRGETPNPDVMCNREIKFGSFLRRARKEGAEYIATGHYAKIIRPRSKEDFWKLERASDKDKDQSYFLCLLKQAQLRRTLFPLGDYSKSHVRAIAREAGLPNADRPESMGICFVGEVKLTDFLKLEIRQTPGAIVTTSGAKIGTHEGLPFYTIGQRHGLHLGGGIPYYIVRKDLRRNRLIVAQGQKSRELFSKGLLLRSCHWVGRRMALPVGFQVRIRHRQELQPGKLQKIRGQYAVVFKNKQKGITPGQFCTLYGGNTLVAAGVIRSPLS